MHRPVMDWDRAARRHDRSAPEGQAFLALQALAEARRRLLALRSGGLTEVLPTENPAVLAYLRRHPRSAPFLSVTNFSDFPQTVDARVIARAGLREARLVHATAGLPGAVHIAGDRIELAPWSFGWLTGS